MQTVKMDLERTMRSIETTKDLMVNLFHQGTVIQCESYELPPVTRESETEHPEYILSTPNSDIKNVYSLLNEINRWYARRDTYDNNLSTKASQRLPGYIQIQMNDALYHEFELVTQQLNVLKEQFKEHVKTIKKPDSRFEILHNMYPMLITTNLYRKVKVFKDTKSVRFYWANKPRIEKVNFARLKERLNHSKKYPNKLVADTQAWVDKVDAEIKIIGSISDVDSLRVIRETKVQPMVSVDGIQTSCPTPIIIVTNNHTPIDVEGLTSYNASNQRKGTGRKAKEYKPLIERLSLYQVIEN